MSTVRVPGVDEPVVSVEADTDPAFVVLEWNYGNLRHREVLHREDLVAALIGPTTTEWGVRHSQGFVHQEMGRPFTEAQARERAAEFIAREPRQRPEARGHVRLFARQSTEWREVTE